MAWQDEGAGDEAVDFSGWRKPRMILAYSDNAKPRPLRWLWPGQIPFGALTFFDGKEGWIHSPAIDLIARATNGDKLPGGALGVGGRVLVLTLDHPEEEVEAALEAARVDRRWLGVKRGIPVWDEQSRQWTTYEYEPRLPEDTELVERRLRAGEERLLVIDCLGEVLDAELFDGTYWKVCMKLTPLALLAGQLGLVVLILRCPESMFPAPRRGWGAGDIPRRTVPRIRWVGNPRYTEYERIIAESGFGWYERERLDIWLRNELAAGPVPMKELEWLAADEGWTPKQLRASKERLRVLAHRHGFGANGFSLWSLPWK